MPEVLNDMITKEMLLDAANHRSIEENLPGFKAILLEAVYANEPLTKDAAFAVAHSFFELKKSWVKNSPRELARAMRESKYERVDPCSKCGSFLFYVSNAMCVRCQPKPEVTVKKSAMVDANVTAQIVAFMRENDMCCVGDIMRAVRANPARIRRLLRVGEGTRWRVALRDKLLRRYTLITAPVVKRVKPKMSVECMKQFGPAFGYDNDSVYQQFIDKGWTDDMLIQKGYLTPTLEMLK
jgi:hypothetical protein